MNIDFKIHFTAFVIVFSFAFTRWFQWAMEFQRAKHANYTNWRWTQCHNIDSPACSIRNELNGGFFSLHFNIDLDNKTNAIRYSAYVFLHRAGLSLLANIFIWSYLYSSKRTERSTTNTLSYIASYSTCFIATQLLLLIDIFSFENYNYTMQVHLLWAHFNSNVWSFFFSWLIQKKHL